MKSISDSLPRRTDTNRLKKGFLLITFSNKQLTISNSVFYLANTIVTSSVLN